MEDNQDSKVHSRDTHAIPPQAICNVYKKYNRMDDAAVNDDLTIVDFGRGLNAEQKERIVPVDRVEGSLIVKAQRAFRKSHQERRGEVMGEQDETNEVLDDCVIYEHLDFPGLRILPKLLPLECQRLLLDSILHRDLAHPLHKTNLHADYRIPYPSPQFLTPALSIPNSNSQNDQDIEMTTESSPPNSSFFTFPQHSANPNHILNPLNPLSAIKPLNIIQFLHKKLRWLTIGAQYDWTTRSYPPKPTTSSPLPTPFPADISSLVSTLFKDSFKPESGVVLLYGTKDYMPVHRDVSELCQRGLASFTIGCDGLFIVSRDKYSTSQPSLKNGLCEDIANLSLPVEVSTNTQQTEKGQRIENRVKEWKEDDNREMETCVLRVRSGDCIWMDGEARFCWHAMPKILGGTSPVEVGEWPALGEEGAEGNGKGVKEKNFERWRGFMRARRLNISCRQVWD